MQQLVDKYFSVGKVVTEEKIVKAIKTHKCIKCGAKIEKGQKYIRTIEKSQFDYLSKSSCIKCSEKIIERIETRKKIKFVFDEEDDSEQSK